MIADEAIRLVEFIRENDEDRIQIKTCICINREGNQGTLPDMFHCPSCIQNS